MTPPTRQDIDRRAKALFAEARPGKAWGGYDVCRAHWRRKARLQLEAEAVALTVEIRVAMAIRQCAYLDVIQDADDVVSIAAANQLARQLIPIARSEAA